MQTAQVEESGIAANVVFVSASVGASYTFRVDGSPRAKSSDGLPAQLETQVDVPCSLNPIGGAYMKQGRQTG